MPCRSRPPTVQTSTVRIRFSGSTASGYVHNGTDSYVFSGDLESLALDGEATVERNGDHIDPAEYPDSVISFIGTGPYAEYSLSVGGNLEKSNANGANRNDPDTISGSTASGYVHSGTDSYTFSGGLKTSISTVMQQLFSTVAL